MAAGPRRALGALNARGGIAGASIRPRLGAFIAGRGARPPIGRFDMDTLGHILAPEGCLRVALNLGNRALVQPLASGGHGGVAPALAVRLAGELDVALEFLTYEGAGAVTRAAGRGAWSVGFLAIDPERSDIVAYTAPYVLIESTYAVRRSGAIGCIADVDRPGRRILAARGSAYELHLARTLVGADLLREASPAASMAAFAAGEADAVAGVRQSLESYFAGDERFIVLPGRVAAIEQAMAVPLALEAAVPALGDFVARAKASGFVREALDRSGQAGLPVAP